MSDTFICEMVRSRTPTSMAVVVGRNMRRLREEYQEASQDEGAGLLRSFGLDWNRSQLAKAERGERQFTLEQLVLVAAAYGVTLADLVELLPDERVALSEYSNADSSYLLASLTGSARSVLPHLDTPQTRHWRDHGKKANEEFRRVWERAPTDAEQRLADSLHTTFDVVNATGLQLWNRSFLEERDARVEREQRSKRDASVSALRGHATRALIAELRPIVEARATRRRK